MNRFCIGVDVAQDSLAVAVAPDGNVVSLGTFQNTKEGFDQITQTISTRFPAFPQTTWHLCLEPTGGFEMALALFAVQQGWQVSLPNPKHPRDWAKGRGQRAKTDKIDARLLALYAFERRPPLWHPASEEINQLDSLLERKRDLEAMIRQEKNRQAQWTRRPQTAAAVVPNVAEVLSALETALSQIEQAIKEHLGQHVQLQQQAKQLQTVPGVGKKNVLPLLVTLSRFDALTEGAGASKALAAYAGLDPTTHESGVSVRGSRGISRLGNRRLRQQLYMGALGGKRGNNGLRVFYERLVARGKAKKVALVAAAHKILTWSWAVFSTQTDFDPQKIRVQTAPAS